MNGKRHGTTRGTLGTDKLEISKVKSALAEEKRTSKVHPTTPKPIKGPVLLGDWTDGLDWLEVVEYPTSAKFARVSNRK
jgi:hypothetical protein